MTIQTNSVLHKKCIEEDFSGVILTKDSNSVIVKAAYGYANRSDQINNTINTRFGIASGTKLLTSIAICQLIEKGMLTYGTKLNECLPITFPNFDDEITIHHLLTHSSGIPDYFDESVMDDFEDLWKTQPMYLLKQLQDFLPLFQNGTMMFKPGERFHYNNAGYIVLGLIVEELSDLSFADYVYEYIFTPSGMDQSGYFSLDSLPIQTAYGYIDFEDGSWKTNQYSIPIVGGSDGGAFITAPDMIKLWESLLNGTLLSKDTVDTIITPHIETDEEDEFYGYGVWITKKEGQIYKYHIMGYDPGVSFHSSYYPQLDRLVVVCCNKSYGAYDVLETIEEEWS